MRAEVLPNNKHCIFRELKTSGNIVTMARDRVNDAPAVVEADVGITMGRRTNVAIQNAGITLVKGDLAGIALART